MLVPKIEHEQEETISQQPLAGGGSQDNDWTYPRRMIEFESKNRSFCFASQ
jgi:hypothetical protein